MNKPTLGIIGGGQLGSLLADAAKNIDIKTDSTVAIVEALRKNSKTY